MHNEYKILMDKVYYKDADFCKMEKMNRVFEDHFKMLMEKSPEMYKDIISKMEDVVYEITPEQAQKIVAHRFGEKWNYTTIQEFLKSKGIEEKCVLFYIEMNKHYFKHYNTAKMLGKEEDADFYFNLSKDSIYEKNAPTKHIEKHFM